MHRKKRISKNILMSMLCLLVSTQFFAPCFARGGKRMKRLVTCIQDGDITQLDRLLADSQNLKFLKQHDNTTGRTLLSYAAQQGNIPAVQLLLEHGASPALADKNGYTPLMYFLSHGYNKHVETYANPVKDKLSQIMALRDEHQQFKKLIKALQPNNRQSELPSRDQASQLLVQESLRLKRQHGRVDQQYQDAVNELSANEDHSLQSNLINQKEHLEKHKELLRAKVNYLKAFQARFGQQVCNSDTFASVLVAHYLQNNKEESEGALSRRSLFNKQSHLIDLLGQLHHFKNTKNLLSRMNRLNDEHYRGKKTAEMLFGSRYNRYHEQEAKFQEVVSSLITDKKSLTKQIDYTYDNNHGMGTVSISPRYIAGYYGIDYMLNQKKETDDNETDDEVQEVTQASAGLSDASSVLPGTPSGFSAGTPTALLNRENRTPTPVRLVRFNIPEGQGKTIRKDASSVTRSSRSGALTELKR